MRKVWLGLALLSLLSGCGFNLFSPSSGASGPTIGITSAGGSNRGLTTNGAAADLYYDATKFSIVNNGISAVQQISLTFSDPSIGYVGGSFPGTAGTCSSTLAIGQTCTIAISSALAIGATATLTFHYNDGQVQAVNIPVITRQYLDLTRTEKFSITGPLLRTGAAGGSDINRFLIGLGSGWMPTTFAAPDGSIYFSSPCKPFDAGGWYSCLAKWDGVTGTGNWIDSNLGTGALDAFYNVGNPTNAWLTFGAGGQVFGVANLSYSPKRLAAATPETITAGSIATVPANFFFSPPGGAVWNGALVQWQGGRVLYDNANYYLYNMFTDGTDNYLGILNSPDFTTFQMPATYSSKNFNLPWVAKSNGHYFMICFDATSGQWVYVPGRSATEFNWAGAVPLHLDAFRGGATDWDYDYYINEPNNNPLVIGAEVVGNYLYVFYLAGSFDYSAGTAPYDVPRGIGALRIPLP